MKINRMSISGYIRKKAVLKKLMPGIRFKFSFFIGAFISVILAAATYINYVNQSSILRKSFNDETENSLNYIKPIVNSMDSIRSNLLLIEDLKIRVNQKSKDLKKYKTYSLRKKDSVSNTFLSIGKKLGMKVRYDYYYKGYESYYSTYLSKKDIIDLEKKTASQLKQPDGNDISINEFAGIQKKANKVMIIQRRIDTLLDKVEDNKSKLNLLSSSAEKDMKSVKELNDDNRKIEIRLAAERKSIAAAEKIFRNSLNRYYNFRLKRLDDTGIYNSNIRIITYDYNGDIKSDTGGYFRESLPRFAPLFENKSFIKNKDDFFKEIDVFSSINSHEYDYISEK